MASSEELPATDMEVNSTTKELMKGAFLTAHSYTGMDSLKLSFGCIRFVYVARGMRAYQAIAVFVIGGTVTHWYFTPKGTKQEDLGNTSRCARCQEGGLCGEFCITMQRKHLGTTVFGALVM